MSATPKGPHTPGLIGRNPDRVLIDEHGMVIPENKILRLTPEDEVEALAKICRDAPTKPNLIAHAVAVWSQGCTHGSGWRMRGMQCRTSRRYREASAWRDNIACLSHHQRDGERMTDDLETAARAICRSGTKCLRAEHHMGGACAENNGEPCMATRFQLLASWRGTAAEAVLAAVDKRRAR